MRERGSNRGPVVVLAFSHSRPPLAFIAFQRWGARKQAGPETSGPVTCFASLVVLQDREDPSIAQ